MAPCTFMRGALIGVIFFVLGLGLFIIWLTYHPHAPEFTLTSLSSDDNDTFHALLDVHNHNNDAHTYYRKVIAEMYHNKSSLLAQHKVIPNFDQPASNDLKSINATIVVPWRLIDEYFEVDSSDGNANKSTKIIKGFALKLTSHVSFVQRPWWITKEKRLWVVCPDLDLVVTMTTSHNSSTLAIAPKPCNAGFKRIEE